MQEPIIDIESIFSDALRDVMKTELAALLREKFLKVGVKVKKPALDKAVAQLIAGTSEPVSFGSKKADAADIEVTEEELSAITDRLEKLAKEGFPKVLKQVSDQAATDLYGDLQKKWKKEHKQQGKDMAQFRARLETRYGLGLDKLRMLLTIAREWGQEKYKRKYAETSGKLLALDDVLIRLQVRGCQVAAEIITLLENGFSDGAMARWRTLHEITATAMVIEKHGAEVAERYVQYQIVESHKALIAYDECREDLGYGPYSKKQERKIRNDYARVIAKYGKPFSGEYGWIAHILGKGKDTRVNFNDIQKAADMGVMRAHYKMASYNVHASPKGVYFKLGQIESSSILLAGSSNAGLVEPAQNAALSLSKLTMLVCNDPDAPVFDNAMFVKVVNQLMREIPHDFARADRNLKRDHRRFKKEGGK